MVSTMSVNRICPAWKAITASSFAALNTAGKVLPRVQAADRACHRVAVRPWHFALVKRQSSAAAYSAALVTLVETVAAQGRLPFRSDPSMQRLREAIGVDGG